MDRSLPREQQLSFALKYLQLFIAQKAAATGELQASNRELEAVLEGVLSLRGELRTFVAGNGVAADPRLVEPSALSLTPDLPRLKREGDRLLKMSRAAIEESVVLRAKSKRLRTALLEQVDGKAKTSLDKSPPVDLSKRERQVLSLIVAGKSSKQIAGELGISFKTTVTHRASIMSKMDVHEIASVVREAIRRGMV